MDAKGNTTKNVSCNGKVYAQETLSIVMIVITSIMIIVVIVHNSLEPIGLEV